MPTGTADGQDPSGRLVRIWRKRFRRGPMDVLDRGKLFRGLGLEGNANQGGKRQVTVLSADAWRRVEEELEAVVDPRLRRANLLVEGLDLAGTTGWVLRVGAASIVIRGQTRPCRLMEESFPGLQGALGDDWRGGVYGEVLEDGEISVGDLVSWERDRG